MGFTNANKMSCRDFAHSHCVQSKRWNVSVLRITWPSTDVVASQQSIDRPHAPIVNCYLGVFIPLFPIFGVKKPFLPVGCLFLRIHLFAAFLTGRPMPGCLQRDKTGTRLSSDTTIFKYSLGISSVDVRTD